MAWSIDFFFTDSWAVANGLASWSKSWKEESKTGDKDVARIDG